MDNRCTDQRFAFKSAKALRPVWYSGALLEHHLIQLTLDVATEAIDQIEVKGAAAASRLYVVAWREGGGFVQQLGLPATVADSLAVREAAASRGLSIETIDPREIMAEPRCSAARAVWALRDRNVDAGMRMAMVSALDKGPMSLDELCTRVPGPADPVAAIASLACAGTVHLDLSESFGPHTTVRRGT